MDPDTIYGSATETNPYVHNHPSEENIYTTLRGFDIAVGMYSPEDKGLILLTHDTGLKPEAERREAKNRLLQLIGETESPKIAIVTIEPNNGENPIFKYLQGYLKRNGLTPYIESSRVTTETEEEIFYKLVVLRGTGIVISPRNSEELWSVVNIINTPYEDFPQND